MDAKSNLFKLLTQIKVDGEDTQKASYQMFKTEEICDIFILLSFRFPQLSWWAEAFISEDAPTQKLYFIHEILINFVTLWITV